MSNEMKVKEKVKLSGVRKIISDKMKESVTQYPQGSLFSKMNMGPTLDYKNELKKDNPSITVTGMIVKMVSKSLEENITMNSAIIGDELITYESINIAVIAESKDNEIYSLVIKNSQDKSVDEISLEIKDLVEKMNTKKLAMNHITGATFTLSNLGMFDLDFFTPLLMPPQNGVLGISTTRKELVVNEDDSTSIQKRACFTFTGNHAATDGAPVARFLSTLKNMIENPQGFL